MGIQFSLVHDDSVQDLLGFKPIALFDEYNLSNNPVDVLSFDIFLATDIAHGMIFKRKMTDNIHNWTMTVDPGYKYVGKFSGSIHWYMVETKTSFQVSFMN